MKTALIGDLELRYRAGLYQLYYNQDDIQEGDRIGFFRTVTGTVCSERVGPEYFFQHGRFPSIYFSSVTGTVTSYMAGKTSVDLYLCFNAKSFKNNGICFTIIIQ